MPEGKHKGKAPFGGRFLSARTDSDTALFPEFHLQEFLKSFPKLHLELGPGQLLQSLFPHSEDETRMLYQSPQPDRRLGTDAVSHTPAVPDFNFFFFFSPRKECTQKGNIMY